MNINAKAVLGYLRQKAEETGDQNYGCEKDELAFYVKVDGAGITAAQIENAIAGDNGLRELRMIYQQKDDPKIYLSSRSNNIDPDSDGATPEQMAQWKSAEFTKFFQTDKDRMGNSHTLAVVKVAGMEEARIVVPILALVEGSETETEWAIPPTRDAEIGVIRYMNDSRHPYKMDEDTSLPIVLAGTNLKAPSKSKFSGHWDLPEDLKNCGMSYYKILQRATSAAIDHVSHADGMKVHLKLAIAYTATVCMFKGRGFKAEADIEGIGHMSVSKLSGDTEAMVFLGEGDKEECIGKAYWRPVGNRGIYKGHVKLIKVVEHSDVVKEQASMLLEAGSVRKIIPLNEKKPQPINTPFANLEVPESTKAQKKPGAKNAVKEPKKATKKPSAKKNQAKKTEQVAEVTGS